MSLKPFTGFRGYAVLCEKDGVQFVIIASNEVDLANLYKQFLPEADPLDPAMCKKSVMIQASILPEPKTT